MSSENDELFPLEKILSGVTASDYCASAGKEISDYKLVGVNFSEKIDIDKHVEKFPVIAREKFSNQIPENTEVVIGYKDHSTLIGSRAEYGYINMSGTALVPKKLSINEHP